ncbi:hypothetical protein [Sphingobium yanoikuyae]|uniref:hypothetical protein n=1 Tax=Sphingobium yanoikuyae TaxID=13690 RepID=UPI0035AE2706
MAIDKVTLVPVWAEVPHLFSDQYRAALSWAEEVANVSTTCASDEAYAAAAAFAGLGRSHARDRGDERVQSPRRAIPPPVAAKP